MSNEGDGFFKQSKKRRLINADTPLENRGRVRGRAAKEDYAKIPKPKRDFLKRIYAAKAPGQAMYKIVKSSKGSFVGKSSSRKGLTSAMKLATYVSRQGDLELENSYGETFNDMDEIKDYFKSEWEPEFSKRKNGNDLFHIVVSTPANSDRMATLAAARDFGGDYMKNHDYLMVRHDDTAYPHVHFIVKNKGHNGQSFPTKKADLEEARESFAHHARAHGIEISASRRQWRAAEKTWYKREGGERDGRIITAREHFNDKNKSAINKIRESWVKSSKEFDDLSKASSNDKGRQLMSDHARDLRERIKEFVRNKKDIER